MAFPTTPLNNQQLSGAGERFGTLQTVLSAVAFQNLLKVGVFAQLAAGSIDNMNGSLTPTIAGVVLRNVAAPIESGGVIDNTIYPQVEYLRQGLVTVQVMAGVVPVQFQPVYASNAVATAGQASNVAAGNIATSAEFINEIKPGIWLIRLV